jgi:hypothetical protein
MKQHKKRWVIHQKITNVLVALVSLIALLSFVLKADASAESFDEDEFKKDSTASVNAFMEVYQVLMSPRCMNCHPSGDIPLQGDDSHLHAMLPQRGKSGKGLYAMKCGNCHQPTNLEGLGKPPGAPHWQLPPANMKMIFQGRTPGQLARQLVNRKTNGNKTMQQLRAHANDSLVMAGWNMGEGRTQPPISYEAFKKLWFEWIDNGAYAPKDR